MIRGILVIAIVVGTYGNGFAQLHSNHRKTPINYLGRLTGFGYSDGYHECHDRGCSDQRNWLGLEPMSSFYGVPSPPTAHPRNRPMPSYAAYQASQMAGGGLEYQHTIPGQSPYSGDHHSFLNQGPAVAPQGIRTSPMPNAAPPVGMPQGSLNHMPPPSPRSLLQVPSENAPPSPSNSDLIAPQNSSPDRLPTSPGATTPYDDPYDLRPSSPPESVPAVPANPSARRSIPGSRRQAYVVPGYGNRR